jgi:hypothetical protein
MRSSAAKLGNAGLHNMLHGGHDDLHGRRELSRCFLDMWRNACSRKRWRLMNFDQSLHAGTWSKGCLCGD